MVRTLSDVRSIDWSPRLGADGDIVEGYDDISQCLAIILTTPKGSDPLRPEFGSDVWKWIDRPVNEAVAPIVREVWEAISIWEPRVELVSVSPRPVAGSAAAHWDIVITWRPAGQLAEQSSVITTRAGAVS